MPKHTRPCPEIPDHVVLRLIGGGAYGQVWLAKAVTGALRAVKVVWREDFEDEKSFEREFEGILQFEPLSRDHPALVHILHVGRSPDSQSFYYYVMELGDDLTQGQAINPIDYQPRTLRADHAPGHCWPTKTCIEVGIRLADALHHLHQHGLVHRDVKPCNVIFINGQAKLADIGLVAPRGQRTFVGTEGFVPLEGPGMASSDVYALGKVLYEIATGRDRLEFPALPKEMPSKAERKQWLALNDLICDACEPRLKKRSITDAMKLATRLRALQKGNLRRRGHSSRLLAWAAVMIFLLGIGVLISQWSSLANLTVDSAQKIEMGLVRVTSLPEGAQVTDEQGKALGITATTVFQKKIGSSYQFTLRKAGYRDLVLAGTIPRSAASEPLVLIGKLDIFAPPYAGEPWQDVDGTFYQPVGNTHRSSNFLGHERWQAYLQAQDSNVKLGEFIEISENGRARRIALLSADEAARYAEWLRARSIEGGYLTENYDVTCVPQVDFDHPLLSERARRNGLHPMSILISPIIFANLTVTSEPPGASIWVNQQLSGTTTEPLVISKIKPGTIHLQASLEGYVTTSRTRMLGAGEAASEHFSLVKSDGLVFGKPWKNHLEMQFVPLGPELMACIWETRVSDFSEFVRESKWPEPRTPDYPQKPDFPIVHVTRNDAEAFCEWLTKRERHDGRLSFNQQYRLPTDLEWSMMVGLTEESGNSPGWRDAHKQKIFLWGASWPVGRAVGNFSDISRLRTPYVSEAEILTGYDDGFSYAAPVGSYAPNSLGIYDLSGNVQEWVSDDYSRIGSSRKLGVLRGGGWNTYQLDKLFLGSRNAIPQDYHDWIYGFRVVISRSP